MINRLLITLFLVLFFCPIEAKTTSKEPIWYLGMCAVLKDDARFLREWIEFHRIVGVQHFFLYDNNSQDETKEILEPYIKRGIVELYDFPLSAPVTSELVKPLNHAIQQAKNRCRWLAILEPDEYLIPMENDTVREFLRSFENFSGIVVNWQMYGTSWIQDIPENGLLTQYLCLKFPKKYGENQHVRSIVNPLDVDICTCPHRCLYKEGCLSVDPRKMPHWGGHGALNPAIPIQKIRINKYYYGPENYWYTNKKIKREAWIGRPLDEQEMETHMQAGNSCYDPVMLRFSILLRKRVNRERELSLPVEEGIAIQ